MCPLSEVITFKFTEEKTPYIVINVRTSRCKVKNKDNFVSSDIYI